MKTNSLKTNQNLVVDTATDARPDRITLDEVGTVYDGFKYLRGLASDYGFKKFSVVEVPWEDHDLASVSILNNWDPEFVAAYDQLGLARNSPIFKHTRQSVLPLIFDVKDVQNDGPTEQRQRAMRDFVSFRRTKGLIVPVWAANGLRGAVCFTEFDISLEAADIDFLHVRCIALFERLISLRSADEGRKKPLLSDRELECLKWTAFGKTSGELAIIADLSESTVSHHLASAARKLNAQNRVHAVAKALRLRLIE